MTQQRTLIIDDAVPYAHEIFSHLGKVITLPGKEINADDVKNADALIIRSRTQINASLLKNSRVSFVGSTVVGLDHVDQDYLKQQQIHFYSAQGCNANSVAEFVINALFELAEKQDFTLSDKTLAIIGVGHVGHLVHEKAEKLGIKCLLNDPPRQRNEKPAKYNETFHSLDECLQADIITFHTPLTKTGEDASYHLLSAERLAAIKPEQIIINAARGGIIDEEAWIHTKTKANIIDCWENEPTIDEALYQTAYWATPHIAGHSLDAKVAGSEMVYHALCKHWQTQPDDNWRKHLPEAPAVINLTEVDNIQTALHQLFKQTHDIALDDQAIRSENIGDVHKKYENYRRNYPVYREWKYQRIKLTRNNELNNLLNSLGFTLI